MLSVVMASYLADYSRAAKSRDKKILRAVDSVLSQTIPAELVVISDGCQKTVDIMNKHYEGQFSGYLINHRTLWAGAPRNTGIDKAKGEIICYMDVDDYMDKNHCEKILTFFDSNDWVWFDDWVYSNNSGWRQRKCDVNKRGMCGTSNLAHKKVNIWPDKGSYNHDYVAIQNLKNWSTNFKYIGGGGYRIGHIPGRYDV